MRGHATRCWRVRREWKDYVLKDSWCHHSRKSEAVILRKLADVEGVPHLINSDDVKAHGQIDTTAVRQVGLSYKEERVHRCLVLEPVAEPLYNFESKKELIQAFVDIVKSKFLSLLIVHMATSLSFAIQYIKFSANSIKSCTEILASIILCYISVVLRMALVEVY